MKTCINKCLEAQFRSVSYNFQTITLTCLTAYLLGFQNDTSNL